MVALAQRVYEGMWPQGPQGSGQTGYKGRNPHPQESRESKGLKEPRKPEDSNSCIITAHPRGAFRGRGRGRGGRNAYQGPPRTQAQPEPNKCPNGVNEKGEPACFKCGSNKHFAKECPGSQEANQKPTVQQSRILDASDSESENE
jgi:zinc knuckle protein